MLPVSLYDSEKIKIRWEYISNENTLEKKEYIVLYTTFLFDWKIIENNSRFKICEWENSEERIIKNFSEVEIFIGMLYDLWYNIWIESRFSFIDINNIFKKWISKIWDCYWCIWDKWNR